MSKILVDELVNLAGTDKVTFSQGVKVSSSETLDLNGATITLSDGIGLNNQLLASTGSGVKWVTFTDTNNGYAFASVNAAANDIKLRLTGSGDAAGQQDQVTFTGAGSVSLAENAGVITITGTDINTTYDITVADITDGGSFTLEGSDGATDSISLVGGSNIDVVRSGNIYTFSTTLSGTVGAPSTTTDNAVALFDGVNGTLLKNSTLVFASNGDLSGVNDIAVNSISAATQTGNKIPFWYDQQSSFPSATTYEGSFAFSDANNTMHYAAGNSWYQIAKLGDIQQNTDTTYSIELTGTTAGTLTLLDSNTVTDVVSFLGRNGVYTFRDNQQLYFDGKLYSISTEVDNTQVVLRLHGENRNANDQAVNSTDDDIVFTGADGLTVERTDANTITFRQGGGSGGASYTDNAAKDAAAQALINGTSLGISFTYDQTARVINAQVGTTPTAFSFTLAAETGNYLVTGSDRGNTFSGDADPSITVYEGDTINFSNTANASHPLYIRVSDGGSSVSSPAASGEGTANVSWTPTSAGTYYYQCGAHPLMIGTITVLSTGGGGGGGSSVLYDLYGTNTTSNNVLLNLDPSLGLTDQIEFAGGDATTITWDASNNKATISSPAQVQSDWSASSGLGEILNKPTIPTAYTLPQATTTTLGGVSIGDGLSLQPSGEIATSLQIVTDSSNTTTNDLSAAGLTLNTNYTTVSGATGDIKRIGDLPHYHDGTDWRPFYLTGTAQQAASSDVNFDDVQVRMNFDNGTAFNHVNRFHAQIENVNASSGAHVAVVTSPVKYGSHALKIFNQVGVWNGDYMGWECHDDSHRDSIWGDGLTNPQQWWNAKRGGCIDWTQDWTVEFWIRFDDIDTVQTPRGIFTVYESNNLNNGSFGLSLGTSGIDPTSAGWALYWNNMRGSSSGHATIQLEPAGVGVYAVDTWYFISLTFDSSTGELILHRDGVNVSTSIAAANRSDTNLVSANGSVNSAGWNTKLGSFYARDAGTVYAEYKNNVYFDDIRFTQFARYDSNSYTAPTSALPITADAPPTVDPDWTNVIVRNAFNTNFNDISQYAISPTGADANASIQTTNVKYGAGALRFTDHDSFLEYYDDTSPFDPSGTFTAEFWINWDALPTAGAEVGNRAMTIWSQTTPTAGNTNDYAFGLVYTTNSTSYGGILTHGYKFFWRNGNVGTNAASYTHLNLTTIPSTLIVGRYNHVALVRDGNGVMRVFFNGFKLRYNTGDTAVYTDTQVTYDTAGDFRIGAPQDPGDYGSFIEHGFEGYIDDFRITTAVKYTDNFTPPSGQLSTTGTVVSNPGDTTSSVTGLATRADLTGSVTVDDNATGNLNITGYKAYSLLKIETDADAWVRVYTDDAARTADSTRSEGEDPGPGDGVIAEVRGNGVIQLSPAPFGYNNDSPNIADAIYTAVTNRSGSTATINVTLTAIRLEA